MNHKDYRREDWDQPGWKKDQQDLHEEDKPGAIRRKKKDSTQVASCCETEESLNGRMRRISEVH